LLLFVIGIIGPEMKKVDDIAVTSFIRLVIRFICWGSQIVWKC